MSDKHEPTKYETVAELLNDKRAVTEAKTTSVLVQSLKWLLARCLVRMGWPVNDRGKIATFEIQENPTRSTLPSAHTEGALVFSFGTSAVRLSYIFQRADGEYRFVCDDAEVKMKVIDMDSLAPLSDALYSAIVASIRTSPY